jgi:MoaA/NifB/PqqE/SkfB family radical SAM enzyme
MERETIKNVEMKIMNPQSPIVVSKLEMLWLKILVLKQLFTILLNKTGSILEAYSMVRQIRVKYQNALGEPLLNKAAKVGGRYYWRFSTPGFPSEALKKLHKYEVNRLFPKEKEIGLRTLLFAITKRCPLQCEHCFEWDNLNKNEALTTNEIIDIVHKYQDYGTTQIMFSGGEPMLRINDIYEVLKAAKTGTDFWIITSGLGFTMEKAKKLKSLGLTGVMISLDHYESSQHNQFRGSEDAWNCAHQSTSNAKQVGLVTTLALCSTRSFTTRENLDKYMELAKSWGVTFVQLIEPRAKGRYAGKNVLLSEEMLRTLEQCYLEYNNADKYKTYPLVNYLGYHQRKVGCFGAGDRFFYIDTDGFAHVCPYCDGKVTNVKDHTANEVIDMLAQQNCHTFEKNIQMASIKPEIVY